MSSQDTKEMRDIQELYGAILETCFDSKAESVDQLVALTLVLRDLALSYHGPNAARSRSVDALDHSFVLDAPTWPDGAVH